MNRDHLYQSLFELIKVTSSEIPADVERALQNSVQQESSGTTAHYAMDIINQNVTLAKSKSAPICQDTGTLLFYVHHPVGFSTRNLVEIAKEAVVNATKEGYLRQNSVDSLTGENKGMNVGPGHPAFHFQEVEGDEVEIKLMLKGGGSENSSAQYALPYAPLGAGRDLVGVRKVILDAVYQAQGKGCGPGILGVCIGSDRGHGHLVAKEQLLRKLDDRNKNSTLAELEEDIFSTANRLGIGPMGFGGKTTLLGCKIGVENRLPASFFVSVAYNCWAYRRQGVALDGNGTIAKWLY
jgi:fumarate hydratase, class I